MDDLANQGGEALAGDLAAANQADPAAVAAAAENEAWNADTAAIELAKAKADAEGLTLELEQARSELAAVTVERDALQAQVDAAQTAPGTARSKASGGRKVSAKDVKDGLEGAELLAAIGGAETVELVFSNGRTEIAGLEAVLISGNAWFIGQAGLQLRLPELLVHGPATGKPGYALGGYGLVLDGKLRAYAPRGDQLTIGAGATVNLAPDVVFA